MKLFAGQALIIILVVCVVGISTVRSGCVTQRSGNIFEVDNIGTTACDWQQPFLVGPDYLNFTISSDSHCGSCSLLIGGVSFPTTPRSCIVVYSPKSCKQPTNICKYIAFEEDIVKIDIDSYVRGDRLVLRLQHNVCPSPVIETTSYRNMTARTTNTRIAPSSSSVAITATQVTPGSEPMNEAVTSSNNSVQRRLHGKVISTSITESVVASTSAVPVLNEPLWEMAWFIIPIAVTIVTVIMIVTLACFKRKRTSKFTLDRGDHDNRATVTYSANGLGRTTQSTSNVYQDTKAPDRMQSATTTCGWHENPHGAEINENHYETLEKDNRSQTHTVVIPQNENASQHAYESINITTGKTGKCPKRKANPYMTMDLSQSKSAYVATSYLSDEYDRNCEDEYTVMTSSPSVSSHGGADITDRDAGSTCYSATIACKNDVEPHGHRCDLSVLKQSAEHHGKLSSLQNQNSAWKRTYVNHHIGTDAIQHAALKSATGASEPCYENVKISTR